VFLVSDSRKKRYALKVSMPPESLGLHPLHESQVLLACGRRPEFPAVHASWLDAGCAHAVMDFLPGKSMHALLPTWTWPLPDAFIADILRQLVGMLHYLHTLPSPVYHMDVKPGNLILGRDGRLRLYDFGIAQCEAVGVWSKKALGIIVGTWIIIPPERIIADEAPLNPLADIYAAGVIGYILATGRFPRSPMPYLVGSPEEVDVPKVPEVGGRSALARVINRATALYPEDRFQTALEFLEEINRI
jgi:serine/threonine-protein kinase